MAGLDALIDGQLCELTLMVPCSDREVRTLGYSLRGWRRGPKSKGTMGRAWIWNANKAEAHAAQQVGPERLRANQKLVQKHNGSTRDRILAACATHG